MKRPLAHILLVALLFVPGLARAGSYVFANALYGTDIVTHPLGYDGSGGVLTIEVCVDPASPNADAIEQAVENVIAQYDALQPSAGNLVEGAANDVPAGQLDFESVLLHEFGHCLGLAHVNLATESGLSGGDREFTRSTSGLDGIYALGAGGDGLPGSGDDVRGDDENLHWFKRSDNDPFSLAPVVDATTYSRELADLPSGHAYPVNGDRDVASASGHVASESVMQQGTEPDEAQRTLSHDDIATLRYAMAGMDEIAGTADDYTLALSYVGQTTSCDIPVSFDDSETSFAVCNVSGGFLYPSSEKHVRILSAGIFFNDAYAWHFSQEVTAVCGNGVLEEGEACDDGGRVDGDCCSGTCSFEPPGSLCADDGNACTDEACDGAGLCVSEPMHGLCDDGAFCNGLEQCDPLIGCVPGIAPAGDAIACTIDVCSESEMNVTHLAVDSLCDDADPCTSDACDELAGCTHAPLDGPDSDGDGLPDVCDACPLIWGAEDCGATEGISEVPGVSPIARTLLAAILLGVGVGAQRRR